MRIKIVNNFYIVILSILGLLVFGCRKIEVKPSKWTFKKQKEVPQIKLVAKNLKLKKYYNFEKDKLWEKPLIIYSENDREGLIIGEDIKNYLMKNRDIDSKILNDNQVEKSMLINNNLILIGNSNENRVIGEMNNQLPIKADGRVINIGNLEYRQEKIGVTYLYPNLYNQNKNMILILGNSGMGYKMVDFKKGDINIYEGKKQISLENFTDIALGDFTQDWEIREIKVMEEED